MLHTVNKSPLSSRSLGLCLRFAQKGEPVLLYEDGVYAAMAGTSAEPLIKEAMAEHEFYAISADVKARGLDKLIDGVKVIDYAGWVDLTQDHKINNWL
ncbi:MAG: sulfurtransferase complex subunit TusB [Spirochaetia bacterium]|nr:sulfurtransferase complex subunit TusB [Spirochaetia bacterium]